MKKSVKETYFWPFCPRFTLIHRHLQITFRGFTLWIFVKIQIQFCSFVSSPPRSRIWFPSLWPGVYFQFIRYRFAITAEFNGVVLVVFFSPFNTIGISD